MQGRVKIALGLGTALLATGALVGCSKGGGSGGAAAAYNDAPASTAYVITPGQYETTVKVTGGSLEGFPPEAQQQLQRAQGNPMTTRSCIPIGFSLESASLKNLRFTLPRLGGQDLGGCNIGDVSQEGGNLRGNLSCDIRNLPQNNPNAPRAIQISANWSGTYTADSTSTFTMHAEGNEPGGSRRGSVDVEISSRRVGDCPAGANPFGSSMPNSTPPMMPSNSSTINGMDDTGGKVGGNDMDAGEMSSNMATNSAK